MVHFHSHSLQYRLRPNVCGARTLLAQVLFADCRPSSIRYYHKQPSVSVSSNSNDAPRVTIIRPCKGFEPYLYECLTSTFQQDYPKDKYQISFCVSSRHDPAFHVLERAVRDFPRHDARICVEEDDPVLTGDGPAGPQLGPNPKIRNMSRAYREAKSDIVWILDCNIWVGRGTLGRMVDELCGLSKTGAQRPFKLVHHIPVAVDVSNDARAFSDPATASQNEVHDSIRSGRKRSSDMRGGRLDEMFLSTAHAKMYAAISSVAVAPCINGKSNMFRRSHLDYLTSPSHLNWSPASNSGLVRSAQPHSTGIDHFSYNICEDHLIGDLLWRSKIPDMPNIRNHGLVFGDLALQPVADMSWSDYAARRVRWLRVRKFTVPVATLVEPGTESFLCSAYGAFGLTTSRHTKDMFGSSWLAFCLLWLLSIAVWAAIDRTLYNVFQSGKTIDPAEDGQELPPFARPLTNQSRRPLSQWLPIWFLRESLALPVWSWAIWGGVTVVWRDRKFWVGIDMKVHEVRDDDRPDEVNTRRNGDVSRHAKIRRV